MNLVWKHSKCLLLNAKYELDPKYFGAKYNLIKCLYKILESNSSLSDSGLMVIFHFKGTAFKLFSNLKMSTWLADNNLH